ncbi:MAG TPA: hypothetical protein VGI30_12785 [Caulobacteraceae bacterium]
MTILDAADSNEDILDAFRSAYRNKNLRGRFPVTAAAHFCIIASVALFCLNLVH